VLRSIGKQYGESVESILERKRRLCGKGFAEKEGFKPGMMDDESGELMEPTEKVPLIGLIIIVIVVA